MNGSHQVSISDLLKISKKMCNCFFPSTDIYSLLLLSLVTVTVYSRKIHHLSVHTRIELAIDIIPDLMEFLTKEGVITEKEIKKLDGQLSQKRDELATILQSYIYAADGLHITSKPEKRTSEHCSIT